ncbi:glycosyltransferase [Pontibacter mangrovi]|uniref:Glycosyltransferase family 4 protein n=1 Tax=Pontibacter mangrovi TaxID=2589816 RepID=A0A501W6Q4_9BACT|nr:glycosyltransferase [Pontibacter mangrovi]TPE42497.1 glycosyltransferase family 4 protein [Pontibacter mangrovi]
MSETRILLASLLKPLNDTRMYEKLGLSLCKLPETQVHLAGFQAPLPEASPANLHFHPIFRFSRLSAGRFLAQQKYERLLHTLKPDLVIACTHELLQASLRYCRQYGAKLVYDVQENYTLNLTSQRHYPPLLRQLLARWVGSTEQRASPAVAHFLLAEESYAQELPFLRPGCFTVIGNKYKPAANYTLPATPVGLGNAPLRLLYSGTIAELYGVFEAVDLAEALHDLAPSTTLTIIGYCAHRQTLQKLQQRLQGKSYITLIGGDRLVPHQQILQHIQACNLGLLPYRPNPSTERCMPTKLYEYMAYALPVLVPENPLWQNVVVAAGAGLAIDFRQVSPLELLARIQQGLFYTSGVPQDVYWETEEKKLLGVISKIIDSH